MSRPLLSLLSLLTACAPESALTANAGAEVVGEPEQTYLLDGTSSAGATYAWSVLDGPGEATLYDADAAVAYLVPEAEGVYTLGLEVCDRAGRCEAATTRAWVGAAARRSALGGVSLGGPSFGAPGLGKNQAPQAEASASRSLSSAGLIRLDGRASTDPDDDPLRYRWSFTARPAGSALTDADIVDNTAALASFRADVSGTYAVRLVVRDGLASDAVTLPGLVVKLLEDTDPVDDEGAAPRWGALEGADARSVSSGGVFFGGGLGGLGKNQAPQAEASASRSLSSAGLIRLDGSASTDPDGDALRYRWTFTARPAGSTLTDADIVDNTAALASFRADVSGTYAVRLVVRDGLASDAVTLPGLVVKLLEDTDPVDDEGAAPRWGALEGADARSVSSGGVFFGGGLGGLGKNQAPQAEASASRALSSASVIRLDGSASTDPDGDALRYRWTFTTRPAGSALTDADIMDSTSALASFKADVSGTYGVRLVVRDGLGSDSVQVPGIVVKLLEDNDPIDEGAAPQHGAVERAR